MNTVSDLLVTPLSGLNHIDALLDEGPDWNFQTAGANVITYTFSTASGNETFTTESPAGFSGNVESFSPAQQAGARIAMAYLTWVTGILFHEVSDGSAAALHFANANLYGSNTTGEFSYQIEYWYMKDTKELTDYKADGYIYLDNAEWAGQNGSLNMAGRGFETLLHELGHALGLKHPFEGDIQLPYNEDSTAFTLMSYDVVGGPYAQFSSYDLAALNWLYGGDGLGGAIGIGSASGARYLTGTARADQLIGTDADDLLEGLGGDDKLFGGAGKDTALFSGRASEYTFVSTASGALQVNGRDGSDLLYEIETLQFSNGKFTREHLLATAAPAAPELYVWTGDFGFVYGNTPVFAGTAEPHAVVKLYSGQVLIGATNADAKGLWHTDTDTLAEGKHLVSATATNVAGVVSALSSATTILVDSIAPNKPAGYGMPEPGSNQPTFKGTAEVGTWIALVNEAGEESATQVGEAWVDPDGTWSISVPLLNGVYSLSPHAIDLADNISDPGEPINFTISSALNRTLTSGKDVLANPAGNNAIDGGAGIDTVVFAGARANYAVAPSSYGYAVRSTASGVDALFNVERLKFDDGAVALDLEGAGGQAYRLYQAALNRTPDMKGVGFWINALDNGVTLDHVAGQFVASPEFVAKFGAQSDAKFLETLYDHVLHRLPDEEGYAFWLAAINSGVSRAHILAQFSESSENQAQVIGQIENGLDYLIWMG